MSENGDESNDSMSTCDEAEEDEEEEHDTDEDDGDKFKLIPATGRLHVVTASSPVAARKESRERNCWENCDYPAHCNHAWNDETPKKRRPGE